MPVIIPISSDISSALKKDQQGTAAGKTFQTRPVIALLSKRARVKRNEVPLHLAKEIEGYAAANYEDLSTRMTIHPKNQVRFATYASGLQEPAEKELVIIALHGAIGVTISVKEKLIGSLTVLRAFQTALMMPGNNCLVGEGNLEV